MTGFLQIKANMTCAKCSRGVTASRPLKLQKIFKNKYRHIEVNNDS